MCVWGAVRSDRSYWRQSQEHNGWLSEAPPNGLQAYSECSVTFFTMNRSSTSKVTGVVMP